MLQVALSDPGIALGGDVRPKGRALEVFEALQDRHVPVTPELAVCLAACGAERLPANAPIWGAGFERAGEAIGLPGSLGQSQFWSEVFDVFVRVVAEPVIRASAGAVGIVHLVATGPTAGLGKAQDYAEYSNLLKGAVNERLNDPANMPPGYWSYAGASLLCAFRARLERRRRNIASNGVHFFPARPEPLTTRLLFDVVPDFGDNKRPQERKMLSRVRSDRERSGMRPREGGVTGVDYSRRLEEIGDALPSTFLLPAELLPLKITEEGFPITHRPPYRHPARDLLTLTFNRAPVAAGPAAVVKAAWADASLRLRHMLSGMKHSRCELAWCDMKELGPMTFALTAEDVGLQNVVDAMELSPNLRRAMLCQMRQFPDLIASYPSRRDQRVARQTGAVEDDPRNSEHAALKAVMMAVKAAIEIAGTQLDQRGKGAESRARAAASVKLEDYGMVLVIGMPPFPFDGAGAAPDWRRDRKTLQASFGLLGAPRFSAAAIYPPDKLDSPEDAFVLLSDREPEKKLLGLKDELAPDAALARLIGDLSLWFMAETLEALRRG